MTKKGRKGGRVRKNGTQCSSHHDLRTAASPSWCRDEQLQASLLRDQRVAFSQLTWEQSPQAGGGSLVKPLLDKQETYVQAPESITA